MTNGHVQPFITWEIFLVCFLSSFSSLLICLLWNSWRLGHSWISSISCLTFSPAPSNAFFPLGSMPRQRHRPPLPHPQMSRNEICRSKNIHPLYPNNSKKEGGGKCCSWTRSGRLFSPGPFLLFLRTEKVWGWCQILPGQGMRVISVVSLSLMPFSSDPNILVWHSTFISIHGFADNATDFVFFPRRFLTLHPQKCSIFKSWLLQG